MSLFAPVPVYDRDGITLYHGDCFEVMPFLRTPVGAVVADLPYGTTRNEWDKALPNKPLWHCYHELIGPRAPVVLFGTGIFSADVMMSNPTEYRYTIIWAKKDAEGADVSGFLNAKKQPLRVHEDLLVFYKAQPAYTPQMVYTGRKSHSRGKTAERTINHYGEFKNTEVVEQDGYQYPHSVIEFRRPKLPKGFGHPSQKPVELMRWLVRTFTTPDSYPLLDNVCGVGTTLVAARAEGRRAIGIEKELPFIEKAIARLESGSEGDRW